MPQTYVTDSTGVTKPLKAVWIANGSVYNKVRRIYAGDASGNWTRVFPPFPTYAVAANASSKNEDGTAVTFTLTTTYIEDGTLVSYAITGSGINSVDISGAGTSGNFTVNNNISSLTLNIKADNTTEGTEYLTLTAASAASATVTINDTSLTPSGAQEYFTPGWTTFVAPAGVTSVRVYLVGGGGGGGGAGWLINGNQDYSWAQGGGGGGGGGYTTGTTPVTPGASYSIYVAAGGGGGATSTSSWGGTGGAGETTTALGLLATGAGGGGGGANGFADNPGPISGAGGAGGSGTVGGGAGTRGDRVGVGPGGLSAYSDGQPYGSYAGGVGGSGGSTVYGHGGAGANSGHPTTPVGSSITGTAGTSGYIRIEWG